VFENRGLRKVFVPKRKEVVGDDMGGVCSTHRGDEKCIKNFDQRTRRVETTLKT
jgi:hypothetical protein